jgi:hypothetical protein
MENKRPNLLPNTYVMPQSGGVKRIVSPGGAMCVDTSICRRASLDVMATNPRQGRSRPYVRYHRHPAGRGMARLCSTKTEPAEISAQPIHSGGRNVFRGPDELPAGAMLAIAAPLAFGKRLARNRVLSLDRMNESTMRI